MTGIPCERGLERVLRSLVDFIFRVSSCRVTEMIARIGTGSNERRWSLSVVSWYHGERGSELKENEFAHFRGA